MSTLSGRADPDLVATIRQVVAAHAPAPRDPEAGVALDGTLWEELEALGLARLTGAESDGGSGAGWHESAALLTELAAAAVALPVGEHDLLAGWLLHAAGLPGDERRRTVAALDAGGAAHAVPWARNADSVVCLWPTDTQWRVGDVPRADLVVSEGMNLAGEPRDELRVDLATLSGPSLDDRTVAELRLRAALLRAVQTAGALDRCVGLTVEHAMTRVQFGRPIGRFQAVQHQVAEIAAEAVLARAAVDVAVEAVVRRDGEQSDVGLELPVAVARSCVGHAASVVVRRAHQLHGAIGTTLEHPLHRLTLPALAWRSEYGSTQHWDQRVADLAGDAGAADLWGHLTD